MRELETFDLETGYHLAPTFYLVGDGSKINVNVFRSPSDVQYACLNPATFEHCRGLVITRETIGQERFEARMNRHQNALAWFSERVGKLWIVSEVTDPGNWYPNSKFVGCLSGRSVRELLPKTFERFQGKKEELVREYEQFQAHLRSLTPVFTGEALF